MQSTNAVQKLQVKEKYLHKQLLYYEFQEG